MTGDDAVLGAQGPQGDPGPAGTPGNTILYGTTDPVAATGVDGNFYINTTTHFIFGPKASGAWPAGISLIGPTGPTGATGATGAQGPQGNTSAINTNKCPDCGNYGFAIGPRGGAGRNIFCANPGCRAGFNVAPLDHPVLVQRIDKGRDCYYPPQVHLLGNNVPVQIGSNTPLCAFLFAPPAEWPIGHTWTRNPAQATCPDCAREFERRWNQRHGR